MSNLIFIDGPPGVGKSTLATSLAAQLPSYSLLNEMDPDHPLHPVPVGNVGADFSSLKGMPVSDLGDLLLEKWRTFLNELGDQQFILESYPFQSHTRVLWQMNASEQSIHDWLNQLFQLLESAQPTLAMLRFTGDDARIMRVYEERGPEWLAFVNDLAINSAYGCAQGWTGPDNAIRFLTAYNRALVGWSHLWPCEIIELEAWAQPSHEQAESIAIRLLALE